MHCRIEAQPHGGLRLIAEIPNYDICQIEGRNGVGKTATLRLLQMCTGDQPYTLQSIASWQSFKNSIGPARIVVDALRGAQTIEWRLTPAAWPEKPAPVDTWLGAIEIDGQVATLDQVRALLRVFRVPGEETLPAALAAQIQSDAGALDRARERVFPRLEKLDDRISMLLTEVKRIDRARLAAAESRAREAARELAELLDTHRDAAARLDRLNELARIRTLRRELRERGPDLERQLMEARAETERNTKERTELETLVSKLQGQAQRTEELARKLTKEEQKVARLRERHRTEAIAAAEAAAEVAISAEVADVQRAQATTADEARSVVRRLEELGATPRLLGLAKTIMTPLEEALAAGVGSEIIAELEDGSMSVEALISAVKRRRQTLEARPAAELARQLESDASKLTVRTSKLSRLLANVQAVERARDKLREAEAKLQEFRTQVKGEHAAAYREALGQLDEAKRREIDLATREAQLERLKAELGEGRPEAELAERIAAGLAREKIEEDDVDAMIEATRAGIAASAITEARLDREVAEARDHVTRQRSALNDLIDTITHDDQYRWLRTATEASQLPARNLGLEENLRRVGKLEIAAQRAEMRTSSVREALVSLKGTLDEIAVAMPSGGAYSGGPLVAATLNYYEREFTAYFNQPDFREALFGASSSDVRVDLTGRSITWISETSEPVTRPFEAFSSGEKAFAYTRARVEAHGKEGAGAQNVVIALDEFGAYIARDSLQRLVGFLRNRVLDHLAHQVLIVLPLAHNYEAQLQDMSPGPSRDELQTRVGALVDNGYFAEPFVSELL